MTGPIIIVAQVGRTPLHLVLAGPLELGRDCDGLLLADERVSRRHLRLEVVDGRVLATDLGSTNGTFYNGERLTSTVAVQVGSALTLGDTTVDVQAPPSFDEVTTRRHIAGTVSGGSPVDTLVRPIGRSAELNRTSIDDIAEGFRPDIAQAPRTPTAVNADDTVTIMFSDIESSTELALSMGDRKWFEVLTEHNKLIEERVTKHGGTVVKNQGDGYMITFSSARRGVLCATEVQQALALQAQRDPTRAIRVRIGLHTGEAIRQDSGDLFGRHVIISARVANLAEGGQVLVSSIVREITSARGDLAFGPAQRVTLKGVEGEHDVYAVDWGSATI